jgi:hypothetical protein
MDEELIQRLRGQAKGMRLNNLTDEELLKRHAAWQKHKDKKIIPASQDNIDALKPQIQQVLRAIADVTGNENIMGAWISDPSMVGDFMPFNHDDESRKEKCKTLSECFGMEITETTCLVDIAKTLRK